MRITVCSSIHHKQHGSHQSINRAHRTLSAAGECEDGADGSHDRAGDSSVALPAASASCRSSFPSSAPRARSDTSVLPMKARCSGVLAPYPGAMSTTAEPLGDTHGLSPTRALWEVARAGDLPGDLGAVASKALKSAMSCMYALKCWYRRTDVTRWMYMYRQCVCTSRYRAL